MDLKQSYFIYKTGVVEIYLLFYFALLTERLFACSQLIYLIQNNITTVDALGTLKSLNKNISIIDYKKFQI